MATSRPRPGWPAPCAQLLAQQGVQPAALIEPTCGIGNFLFAGLDRFKGIGRAVGADINSAYVKEAEATLRRQGGDNRATLVEADFFATDWDRLIGDLPEPVLILGNLPWVTSAHLSRLDSQNLPAKSNFQNHAGLDAITGKANFDISLWMLIRLLEAMNGRRGTLAMLCKSSVARKTLHYGWQNGIMLEKSAIHAIDAECFFDAAVDAVLLVTQFAPGARDHEATVYPSLSDSSAHTVLGFEDGALLADISAYHRWKHLCGAGGAKWRSGIKHDCSKVMELCREGGHYRNGLGELVELEEAFLYPMLKSSGLANGGRRGSRYMIVTQSGHRRRHRRNSRDRAVDLGLPDGARRPSEPSPKFHLPEPSRRSPSSASATTASPRGRSPSAASTRSWSLLCSDR